MRLTCQNYEILLAWNFNYSNFWLINYSFWVSFEFRKFCFNISKCSCYWQSSRHDSMWSKNISMLLTFIKYFYMRVGMLKPSLINFSSTIENSLLLILTTRLMINRELAYYLTQFATHYSSAITNISNIKHIPIEKCYNSARARAIQSPTSWILNKSSFTFFEAYFEGCLHIVRETTLKTIYDFSLET